MSSENNTEASVEQKTQSTTARPTERTPGTTMLPIARIKRVIKEDKDVSLINAEATFCISYATELFMEYLVTEAFSKAKKDKRKTVYYRDLANTVKEVEQFEFLEDVIPPTMTLKAAYEKRKEVLNEENGSSGSGSNKRQKVSSTQKQSQKQKQKEKEIETEAEADEKDEDEVMEDNTDQ